MLTDRDYARRQVRLRLLIASPPELRRWSTACSRRPRVETLGGGGSERTMNFRTRTSRSEAALGSTGTSRKMGSAAKSRSIPDQRCQPLLKESAKFSYRLSPASHGISLTRLADGSHPSFCCSALDLKRSPHFSGLCGGGWHLEGGSF